MKAYNDGALGRSKSGTWVDLASTSHIWKSQWGARQIETAHRWPWGKRGIFD